MEIPVLENLNSEASRRDLARILIALFDRWELSTRERMELLSLSPGQRKLLAQYRRGARALPLTRDALDRAGLLLGIHRRLVDLFPEDEALRFSWVRCRNRLLHQSTPLDVMRRDGMLGVFRITRLLEWQLDR